MVRVLVNEGFLQGRARYMTDGRKLYYFKGIPYAKPPVGRLRFQAPEPPIRWIGIRDASEHGPVCPQANFNKSQEYPFQDESCLYLNVYTPTLNETKNLPVMLWIHGGMFKSGSGDESDFSPNTLLTKDVVLVTFNYRLEVFGFLCLDIPEAPGNAGLKDQVAAMKWIRKNIYNFGGDPYNVTIFGQSSGAMCVSLHLVSPLSRSLYHKAIMQSGVGTNIVDSRRSPKEIAFQLGRELGMKTDNPYELLNFLQSVDYKLLIDATSKLIKPEDKLTDDLVFVPCIEKEDLCYEYIIDKHPVEYMLTNEVAKVPIIAGFNILEAAPLYFLLSKEFNIDEIYENTPEILIKPKFRPTNHEETEKLRMKIKEIYDVKDDIKCKKDLAIVNLMSDCHFVYPAVKFLNLLPPSRIRPDFYMYCLKHPGKPAMTAGQSQVIDAGWNLAQHADDLLFLFNDGEYEGINETVEKHLLDLWTDFAMHGNPTPDDALEVKWKPYTKSNKTILIIDEELSVAKDIFKERMEFWDELNQSNCSSR